MKCGGKVKMAIGGVAPKPFAAGIPYAAGAGQTDGKNGKMKKGGAIKKMQDGGKVVKTKRKTTVPASWRTADAVKSGYWDSNTPEIGQSEKFGNTTVKKNAVGRTTLKTPYTETAPSGKKSVGTITDKFNRKGQLTKTVTKSNVTSPTGAQYKSKDINKVSTRTYKKGGSSFGMLSVKAGFDNNPGKSAADRIAGAKMKKGTLTKKQLGGPATPNNPNPTRTLENAALFIGGGLATALAARKQNQPMTQKKKEKVLAKQQKRATRKSK
jgi:hypothetical protein